MNPPVKRRRLQSDGWVRLNLGDATAVNANSSLSGSASDDGTGIQAAIVGSAARTDPFDSWHLVWVVLDPITGGVLTDFNKGWQVEFLIVERTAPGLSSDFSVVLGLVTESADSGTIDGQFGGLRYSGAGRNVRLLSVNGGTAGNFTDDTASAGTLRQAHVMVDRQTSYSAMLVTQGRDSAGAQIANDQVSLSMAGGGANWTAGAPYIVASYHRTAATAGTETGKFDLYYKISPPSTVKT